MRNQRRLQGLSQECPEGDESRIEEDPNAEKIYIETLQRYNKIKDVAQEVMGLVADNRGVSVWSLYADGEFGVGPDD